MAACKNSRKAAGDGVRFSAGVAVPIQGYAPMDRDSFGSAFTGAGAGRDLYGTECFFQPRRVGCGDRDRTCRFAAAGPIPSRTSERTSTALAQRFGHCFCPDLVIRGLS